MNETARNSLYSQIQTTDELSNISDALHAAVDGLFKHTANISPLEALEGKLPNKIYELVKQAVAEKKVDPQNTQALKDILETFLDALDGMQEITLILAIDPSQKTLDDLSEYVKDAFGLNSILCLKKDRDIVGGAIIIFGGRYLDYSVRKKLKIMLELKNKQVATEAHV